VVSIGSDGTAVTEAGPLAAGIRTRDISALSRACLAVTLREEKLILLEEAIRKMTSANAAKVRQYDRGLLRPGMAADVTIFKRCEPSWTTRRMRSLTNTRPAWST